MVTESSAPERTIHTAIIMDGNGRWAQDRGRPRFWGHVRGVNVASKIIEIAVNLNLKALTLFSFSTENWSRPEREIKILFKLLGKFILKEKKRAIEKKIRFRVIGDINGLPAETIKIIQDMEKITQNNNGLKLTLAFGYGGRAEIVSAVNKHIVNNPGKEMTSDDLEKNLLAPELGDVDVMIRTGGDVRISNFLLWQLAYAELFFVETKWPDFTQDEFVKIIESFTKRERRFGYIASSNQLNETILKARANKRKMRS